MTMSATKGSIGKHVINPDNASAEQYAIAFNSLLGDASDKLLSMLCVKAVCAMSEGIAFPQGMLRVIADATYRGGFAPSRD